MNQNELAEQIGFELNGGEISGSVFIEDVGEFEAVELTEGAVIGTVNGLEHKYDLTDLEEWV